MSASKHQVGGDQYMGGIQPWDVMQSLMSHEAFAGYLRGCALKYLARYQLKDGVEDLRKCRHYLDKLIEVEVGE